MSDSHPSFEVAAPEIVVIAAGDTASEQANERGHLFERFVARVFEAYGCDAPTKSTLNVKQNGYEVDISTQLTLNRERAIAECKAYTSPLPSKALSEFYGKLGAERLDDQTTHGWFVAVPGLTSDGFQLARKLESGDKRFRLFTAIDLYELAKRKKWIGQIVPGANTTLSDHALLITSQGLCALAKQLDSQTRLPSRVLVQRAGGTLTASELDLLASSDYAADLEVIDAAEAHTNRTVSIPADHLQTLVSVVGSKEDFEYQFPAAPEFFVGRDALLATAKSLFETNRTHGQVFVLNAQSGWGKSSLALKLAHEVREMGGCASVFDTRTATSPSYVAMALRKAITDASADGRLMLPADASFASVQSALRTLQSSILSMDAPLLVFFDQFENIFRDSRLTQEFRDLALAIRELSAPLIIGFSWKTDLVALTENYPYRLRDEIRSVAHVLTVEQFGPRDVGVLLARLSVAAGTPLSQDLKQRLREYSQGLPWLLKKLANHILRQLRGGTSEEALLADSLNIESLFEQDLASLQAQEVDALKMVARHAPALVSDIVERVDAGVIQALVDQRLVVRVGERLDVYWDIFREFLLTGKVAIQDTFIVRQRPRSTAALLRFLVERGGEATAQDASSQIATSLHVVFNNARDLRQLGILSPKSGSLVLAEQFRARAPTEQEIRDRIGKSLRRHSVFTKIQELMAASTSHEVSVDALAHELPSLFPAVEASKKTWRTYALSFCSWLDYSGVFGLKGQFLVSGLSRSRYTLLGQADFIRRAKTFPHSRPETTLTYLRERRASQPSSLTRSTQQKAMTDLYVLGLVDSRGLLLSREASRIDRLLTPSSSSSEIRSLIMEVPGGREAIELIRRDPAVRPEQVGIVLRDSFGLPWADSTTRLAGDKFRAWARAAGIELQKVRRRARADASGPICE